MDSAPKGEWTVGNDVAIYHFAFNAYKILPLTHLERLAYSEERLMDIGLSNVSTNPSSIHTLARQISR